jgi:hypothetical protein
MTVHGVLGIVSIAENLNCQRACTTRQFQALLISCHSQYFTLNIDYNLLFFIFLEFVRSW